ncbi:MAG: conserved repeat domain protein [Actinomycetia bacterium]|nr:conserved repeat domain protein [Actinomycetes bacterium]
MIHTSRRTHGARSLVVLAVVALFGVVQLPGSSHEARADGPVRHRAIRHFVPTHRIARHGWPTHRIAQHRWPTHSRPTHRRHVRPEVAKVSINTRAPSVPIVPGKVYSWPFTVRNRGPVRADAVTFRAPLPGSLQFVSAQQNCSFKDNAAICELGSLKSGEGKVGVINALVGDKTPAGQPIDSAALATWHSTPENKEGRASAPFPQVKVADTADVSVVKDGPPVIRTGERIPYNVTVANNGPTPARNVVLTSTSTPFLTQDGSACTSQNAQGNGQVAAQGIGQANGQGNGQGRGQGNGPNNGLGDAAPGEAQGLVCDIGTLQPGETRAIKINAQARSQLKPGTLIQAPSHVTTSTIDTNEANNHANSQTKVTAIPEARTVFKSGPGCGFAPGSAPGSALGSGPGSGSGHGSGSGSGHGSGSGPGSGSEHGSGSGHGPGCGPGSGPGSGYGPGSGPQGMTGLPNTGAPTTELLHLVIVLLGTGLILYRVGRSRRRRG